MRLAGRLLAASLLVSALAASAVHLAKGEPASLPAPTKLNNDTVAAFNRYVQLTEERNDMELKRGSALLWIDSLPETQHTEAYAALKRGDVQIHQLVTLDGGQSIACPGGLIHHWVGAVFIPGAKLEDVLSVLQDYDHQSTYYSPDVERSKIESRVGD